jgi:hypothetical protein
MMVGACGGTTIHRHTAGVRNFPPVIGGPLFHPVKDTLLLDVLGANDVSVCFEGAGCVAARQPRTLPKLPGVQHNLLNVFKSRLWMVQLPKWVEDQSPLTVTIRAANAELQQSQETIQLSW